MQKITTPKGETLVILPIDEYEALVDRSDIAGAEKVRAVIAAGRDELVPAAVVDRILAGENPVRVWRSHRSMSARDLAAATGLSASYISEIEGGTKSGSLSAMKKIAEALRLDLDDIA
jgi:DNA-binding XRE family transcriptional regulator